jgi:FkbM family methyltransferase
LAPPGREADSTGTSTIAPRTSKPSPAPHVVYDEVIVSSGVKVPFVPAIISPKIERPLRNNRYEARECTAVRRMLRPGDRVLELGAGVGLLSTVAGLVPGIESVTAVEANPDLIPLIRETHRLNQASAVTLLNAVASAEPGPDVDFYLRPNFWASSMEPDSRPYDKVVKLPRVSVSKLIKDIRPTVIICDIEGGELGLFDTADLESVRAIVIELHPKVYGRKGLDRIKSTLRAKGLAIPEGVPGGAVQILSRVAHAPTRSRQDAPGVAIVAEVGAADGPYLLEWLGWHKAAGASEIVAFSATSEPTTIALLDRLDALGMLRHLPHPAVAAPSGEADPLAFALHLPALRSADFAIALTVCDFVNIRTEDHSFRALIKAAGPFDVMSAPQVIHGANRQENFADAWVTQRFPLHQTTAPDGPNALWTIRSITRLSDKVESLGPFRPAIKPDSAGIVWLDGSARPLALTGHPTENRIDCRDAGGLLRIEHFPLRDLDSYFAWKVDPTPTTESRRAFKTAWIEQNLNQEDSADLRPMLATAQAWHRAHLAADAELVALHQAACDAHLTRVAAMSLDLVLQRRRQWALTEAW